MKTLFVMNGVTFGASGQPCVSGGDVMLIEIAKRWMQNGVDIHFMTSSAGKELCEKLGLKATYHLSSSSGKPSIQNYLSLALKAAKTSASFTKKEYFDLVYSSCEHLYDVLPALELKRQNSRWIAMVHFVPPPPWTRAKAGGLNAILYYFNHMTGAYILRSNADLVFAVSQKTAVDYVNKLKFDKHKVVSVPGGVYYSLIRSIVNSVDDDLYDAVFMKRLQPMKGVFDAITVWHRVVASYPKAKLLIIGDGPSDVVARMQCMITEFRLGENVEMIGPVYDIKEKISLLAKSKLFLLPSYEENWAIVVGEALAAGLPVIAYDLAEIREIWGNHVSWVPKGNAEVFASEVVKLLSDDGYYQKCSDKGVGFMKQYDWDNIAEKELELCTTLTDPKKTSSWK
jgi:glycosyltransferase involved in cell wall biosynthesis